MNKAELRKLFKEKREQIQECDLEPLSMEISHRFFDYFDIKKVKTVHCFLPALKKREINTWHIIEGLRVEFPDIRIAVPRCLNDGEMISGCLQSDTILEENKWGIPEPVDTIPISPEEIDLVILPLLAYDSLGNRIGYGKGFYDRFLSQCRPDVYKVGLSFFEPVEKITDLNEFDIPVNAAITPEHVFNFEVI